MMAIKVPSRRPHIFLFKFFWVVLQNMILDFRYKQKITRKFEDIYEVRYMKIIHSDSHLTT